MYRKASSSGFEQDPIRTTRTVSGSVGGSSIDVLVGDQHPVVRRGLRAILTETHGIRVCAEAPNADALLRELGERSWDVVVLELALPGGNGLDLVRDVRSRYPRVQILVLTTHSVDGHAARALRAGAAGFLTKDSPPAELVEAVQRIAGGGKFVTPVVAESLARVLSGEADAAPHECLSAREMEVMRLLASGLTLSAIAADLKISKKTVCTHRMRMLRKMRMSTTAELVHYAIRREIAAPAAASAAAV